MNWQVELNNFCNFTCGYCPNKDMKRKRQFMSDEVWQTILHDYIVPYKDVNSFCPPTFIGHKDSEPLIDRKLPSRLINLSAVCPNMKIDIYSNGVLLPAWAKRGEDFIQFLATLPNRVRYMMSFHPYNHDGSVNNYEATMVYMREVLRNPPPNIEFITVSHRSKYVSEATQESWTRYWQGYPITVHNNCSINPWTGLIEDQATCHYNGCPYADFGHFFFGVTGNIIACCLDLEEEIILGNVMTDDPATMFAKTDAFYRRQRETLATHSLPEHQVCYNCYGHKRNDLVQLGTSVTSETP